MIIYFPRRRERSKHYSAVTAPEYVSDYVGHVFLQHPIKGMKSVIFLLQASGLACSYLYLHTLFTRSQASEFWTQWNETDWQCCPRTKCPSCSENLYMHCCSENLSRRSKNARHVRTCVFVLSVLITHSVGLRFPDDFLCPFFR